MKNRKFYRCNREIEIAPQEVDEMKVMKWCKSPVATIFPSCMQSFYSCEFEEAYGPVKHDPEFRHYLKIKQATMVECKNMPTAYCQRLIEIEGMVCPHCKQPVCVEEV
jgi:hypothetical protein